VVNQTLLMKIKKGMNMLMISKNVYLHHLQERLHQHLHSQILMLELLFASTATMLGQMMTCLLPKVSYALVWLAIQIFLTSTPLMEEKLV